MMLPQPAQVGASSSAYMDFMSLRGAEEAAAGSFDAGSGLFCT
jgi:hypothetical protein